MSILKTGFMAGALAFAATGAMASSVTLNGTLRDFQQSHPSMQIAIDSGIVTGVVEDTLGPDGKPVFSGNVTTGSYAGTDAAVFAEWFNDSAASETFAYGFEMEQSGGLFSFNQPADFFPLLAENGSDHFFTLEVSGYTIFSAADTFSLAADDDLWLFIGGTLVADLGGVKAISAGGQPLEFTGQDLIDTYGLNAGQEYAFSLFFAERNTVQSGLVFQTSAHISATPIPLPAAGWLLIGGLGALAALRRRKRAA